MTSSLTHNEVECARGYRQNGTYMTYQEAFNFCGKDGLQTKFDSFPRNRYKRFWTGFKRYNETHFTDGVDIIKIGNTGVFRDFGRFELFEKKLENCFFDLFERYLPL